MQKIVEGSIVHIEKYSLPHGCKNKFFIVLFESDEDVWLFSMTTSQKYLSESLIEHGKIVDRNFEYYCFKAKKQICKNGYSFSKDTFLKINRENAIEFTKKKLEDYKFTIKGILHDEELLEVLYAFYSSDKTKKKVKIKLEQSLSRLSHNK